MIKKIELNKQIDSVNALERIITPLLKKHISSSLFFSNLKKDERDLISEKFQKLVTLHSKHLEVLKDIKEEAARRKEDVF